MSRGIGRREGEVWRRSGYGHGAAPVYQPPFYSDLIHANLPEAGRTMATGVAAWADQIASATPTNFVQADTSKQPAYGLFTTKPALVFDDTNDFMQTPAVTLAPLSQITVAFSASWLAAGTGMLLEASVNAGANAGAFYVYENGATYQVIFRNTAASRVRGAPITAGVHRMIIVFDANVANPSAIPTLYLDGVSSGAAPGASDTAFGNYAWYMGMRAGTSEPWGGKIGDIWVYGRALTVGEIATVDAALAARCT
jgi:hypothetical protein